MQPLKNQSAPLPGKVHEVMEETFSRYPLLNSGREGLLRTYDAITTVFEQHGILYLCGNGGSFADAVHIKGELAKRFETNRPIRDPGLIARLHQSEIGKRLLVNLECGFPVIVLGESHSLRSAYENDREPALAYAQELYSFSPLHNRPDHPQAALGGATQTDIFNHADAVNARASNCVGMAPIPGVLLGISTSGNAENVMAAMSLAKAMPLTTISFTGPQGGSLAEAADIDWRVPGDSTAAIQENQVPLYHALCRMIEMHFFG